MARITLFDPFFRQPVIIDYFIDYFIYNCCLAAQDTRSKICCNRQYCNMSASCVKFSGKQFVSCIIFTQVQNLHTPSLLFFSETVQILHIQFNWVFCTFDSISNFHILNRRKCIFPSNTQSKAVDILI